MIILINHCCCINIITSFIKQWNNFNAASNSIDFTKKSSLLIHFHHIVSIIIRNLLYQLDASILCTIRREYHWFEFIGWFWCGILVICNVQCEFVFHFPFVIYHYHLKIQQKIRKRNKRKTIQNNDGCEIKYIMCDLRNTTYLPNYSTYRYNSFYNQ